MIRSRRVAILFLFVAASWAHSVDAPMGIVTADRVRLRRGPSTENAIVRELSPGTIASIVEATADRDRIDPSREFSYCWYNVELNDGTAGWIYGQYFYPLESTFAGTLTIEGQRYRLAVFREDGYLNDMPNQDQYALPCLVRDGEWRASIVSIDPQVYGWLPSYQETSGREGSLPGTTFLLVSNTGMHEAVESASVGRSGSSEVLRLAVKFSLQTGGGGYTLVLAPPARAGEPFTATDVQDAEIDSGL